MSTKLFAVLLALALASSPMPTHHSEYASIVQEINNSDATWTASTEFVESLTEEQISNLVGTILEPTDNIPEKDYGNLLNYLSIPESFDSRTQWPERGWRINNQGQCGSCWAFGAAEIAGDRQYTQCTDKKVVYLSEQQLVSCDGENYGCQGGYPIKALEYIEKSGLTTSECYPYSSGNNGNSGQCQNKSCEKYYFKSTYSLRTIDNIKANIMQNGPVEGAFSVYQDFMAYKKGIYTHKSGSYLGGHAIKILGWGVQNGVEYWICANSWGPSWGMDGYFWIATNQCGISDGVVAGDAKCN